MVLYTSAQESGGHEAPAITNMSVPNVNRNFKKKRKRELFEEIHRVSTL